MSATLSRRRIETWATLTAEEQAEIDKQSWSLRCAASDLVTEAVGLDVSALEKLGSAAGLLRGAAGAQRAMAEAATIHSAISFAAGAIDLAAALARGDFGEAAMLVERFGGGE